MLVAAGVVARMVPVAHDVAIAGVLGAAGGLAGHWRATVPATVTAGARLANAARRWFVRHGYALDVRTRELVPKMPRPLRVDSQNVRFVREPNGAVTIIAPYFMLKAWVKGAAL